MAGMRHRAAAEISCQPRPHVCRHLTDIPHRSARPTQSKPPPTAWPLDPIKKIEALAQRFLESTLVPTSI